MITTCFLGLLAGCSVNGHGIGVRTRTWTSSTVRVDEVRAWGLHLSTEADAGLIIGSSTAAYITARDGQAAPPSIPVTEIMSRLTSMSEVRNGSLPPNGGPLLGFVAERTGAALDLNAHKVGVVLGFNRAAVLTLPRDADCLLYIDYDSSNDQPFSAYYQENRDETAKK